jgi:hypothetical protein
MCRYASVVSTTQEAEAEGSREPKSLRQFGNIVRLPTLKKGKRKGIFTGFMFLKKSVLKTNFTSRK